MDQCIEMLNYRDIRQLRRILAMQRMVVCVLVVAYLKNLHENMHEDADEEMTENIFAGSVRIVSRTPDNTFYYHADHLGSSSVITDISGYTVQEIYYYPYGQTRLNNHNPMLVDVSHKFTGQEEDIETGLYYYGARYYDPAIGRFITADSIVPNFADPQSLNRYSYTLNNPIIYTDPNGNFPWFAVLAGAAFGGVMSAITGGDIWDSAAYSAMGWAAGEAANMLIARTIGSIMSGGNREFKNGAAYYYTEWEGAFTIGGAIIGNKNTIAKFNWANNQWDYNHTVDQHERSHFPQQNALSISYIPAHLFSQGMSWIFSGFTNTHRYNVLERWWIDVPGY